MQADTNIPPEFIDGARVIHWAWSGDEPFGYISATDPVPIFGLAIVTYDGQQFYRFACDSIWDTQQDAVHDSIAAAKDELPDQYRNVEVTWISK